MKEPALPEGIISIFSAVCQSASKKGRYASNIRRSHPLHSSRASALFQVWDPKIPEGIKGRAQGDRRKTVKIWIWTCWSDHHQAGIRTKESLLVPFFPPSIFLVWTCSFTSEYLTFCSRTFA